MQIVVQKKHDQIILQLCYVSQAREQRTAGCHKSAASSCSEKQLMKRCAQCHRKLGLGVRFRNIWNGHWWVHVRFCSVRCEAIYEVKRNDAVKHRWLVFLARGSSPS